MNQKLKRVFSGVFAMVVLLSLGTGCETRRSGEENSVENERYETFLTVDVFCSQANYQGIQAGWFGEVVKERFNMELNIIAPNVAGGGAMLFETRSAAGNLGDIVMIGAENGYLEQTVDAGLLLDITDYTDLMPHIMQYPSGIEMIQELIKREGVYAIPSELTSLSPLEPSEGTEPTFGPYLRWDLYTDIGSPDIENLEALLPVLKDMQSLYPETESGEPTYAFSLFGDWDSNMMTMGKQPACLYGYDEVGFLLNKADGSDAVSIIEDDSPYVRSLKLYYEANQMGLLDPDSATQSWDDVWNKCVDGQLLFSFWPWLGQSAYNTVEHMAEGKGFMMATIDDMEIYSYGANLRGSKYVVGVGAQAQDPERMVAFIDWLYSPEGIMLSTSQTGSTCGPEGLTWELVDDEPVLTDFGIQAMFESGAVMPSEYGGGLWSDGVSQLNFTTVLLKDINPENNQPYDFRFWDSYIRQMSTPLHKSWQEATGYLSTFELLEEEGMVSVATGNSYIPEAESAAITTLRNECRAVIIENSWKMIFAKDQETFYYLLKDMQEKVMELGYEQVIAVDYSVVDKLNLAREEVLGLADE